MLIGIQERTLTDRAAIDRWLETTLSRTGEERDRITRAVLPFCEALARGPIADPEALVEKNISGFSG